ncbi:MAG: type II toxin-antitoxin system VapC family toxin [Micropruina sp.]
MNGYLLDTNALYWLMTDDPSMGPASRAGIAQASVVAYSAASIWELEIKRRLGRIPRDTPFEPIGTETGLTELPITAAHAGATGLVDLPHRDPFDRMLLAQATVERLGLLTSDRLLLSLGRPDVVDARL